MSAFGIFALILTTAYIIYFMVVIGRDVAASRKTGGEDNQAETFDVSEFAQEESVEVKEISGGFAIGDAETQTETVKAGEEKEPSSSEGSINQEKLKEELTDKMEVIEPDEEFEIAMNDIQFREGLNNGTINGNCMIKREVVTAGEPIKEEPGNVQGRDAM